MTIKSYLLINKLAEIVENVILWDGNTDTWPVPEGYVALPEDTTPAKIWKWNEQEQKILLEVEIGAGRLGFAWDGEYAITNEPNLQTGELA